MKKIPSDWDKSVISNLFKGKGTDRGNYRGLIRLEHPIKLFEQVFDKQIRNMVNIDEKKFGFMPGKGIMEAILMIRKMQEKHLAKRRTLYLTFVDLEKAFNRVPRKVDKCALRKVRVGKSIIEVIFTMYSHCRIATNCTSDVFDVGVQQGFALSPLLFIIVMEALLRDFRVGLPWEIMDTDDLALIAESLEDLEGEYAAWKKGMESKGMHIKTKHAIVHA